MPTNRAFFSQGAVDRWLAEGRVALEGEVLGLLPRGPSFLLTSAVLFGAEVAGDDAPGLSGKIKTLPAIEELAGEHASGSVVLGDHAYEVVDGFLAELLEADSGSASALAALSELAELASSG